MNEVPDSLLDERLKQSVTALAMILDMLKERGMNPGADSIPVLEAYLDAKEILPAPIYGLVSSARQVEA